jgi:hypothetical protein
MASQTELARRAKGQTQKDAATELGVTVAEIDRLERAGVPSDEQVWAIGEELDEPSPRSHPASMSWVNWGILACLAAIVTVRFFTEVISVVPRFANFIDIPICGALFFVAACRRSSNPQTAFDRRIGWIAFAFLAVAVAATLANLGRISPAPAFTFIYGVISPVIVYLAVRRLWSPGFARTASQAVVLLGVVQLIVVAVINLPEFIASNNPDEIAGTFGTNAYQLVFFLLLFSSLLIGIRVHEPQRLAAKLAPALIAASVICIVLAQYRSLLLTTFMALLLATAIVGRTGGRTIVTAGGVVAGLLVVLTFAAQHVPVLKVRETSQQDPVELLRTRLAVLDQLDRLYTDHPIFALTGTGPGTYSSRGWQTFALADSESTSNVAGGYATSLTGGEPYHTDVSDEYVAPSLRNKEAVAGSSAVNNPLVEYVAIAAETGILGVVAVAALYGVALFGAGRATVVRARAARPGDAIPALLAMATVGLFVLIQMGMLQNWLEVTRLTFPTWIILGIAWTEQARYP